MIGGALNGDWYRVHVMDGLGYLREDNAEMRICQCASSRSGLGVEVFAPNSEAFCAILEASPVVDASVECIWRREKCSGMTGLEFEAL